MKHVTPKFQEAPEDQTPVVATMPDLNLCALSGQRLTIPDEVRNQFLSDPIRSCEWKKLLADFDRKCSGEGQSQQQVTQLAETSPQPDQPDGAAAASLWETSFPDEPTTKTEFEAKYQAVHSFAISDNLAGVIVEGPKLFLQALGEVEWPKEEPILFFGAGGWLLDQKATTFMEDGLRRSSNVF